MLSSLHDFYFQFNPLIRGLVWAGVIWIGIELIKPSLFYGDTGESFIAKPFGSAGIQLEDEGLYIPGTYFPWWLAVISAFILFGLII